MDWSFSRSEVHVQGIFRLQWVRDSSVEIIWFKGLYQSQNHNSYLCRQVVSNNASLLISVSACEAESIQFACNRNVFNAALEIRNISTLSIVNCRWQNQKNQNFHHEPKQKNFGQAKSSTSNGTKTLPRRNIVPNLKPGQLHVTNSVQLVHRILLQILVFLLLEKNYSFINCTQNLVRTILFKQSFYWITFLNLRERH